MSGQTELNNSANAALQEAFRRDQTVKATLDRSAGYAVFPTVGEGGLIVGGGYGKGAVYEKGQIVGYCDMTALSAGAKIGGQSYSEIIAFETPQPLADFKNGRFTLSADASAVALRDGVAGQSHFRDNVAVFVYDQGGLMADASVGGQQFRFTPMDVAQAAAGKIEGQPEPMDAGKHQERLNHRETTYDQDTKSSPKTPDVNVDTNRNGNPVDVQVK
jgi:lipid-binding SYLF domain-containing protein